MASLTEKQKRFCEEYLIDLNGTQAAIRAGYSFDSAGAIASENLTKLEIQEYLTIRQSELITETGITQKRVLEEYAKIAFADIRKMYTVDGALKGMHDLDDDAAAALAGVDVYEERVGAEDVESIGVTKKIKMHDKIRALDAIGKHLGMFKNIHELTGKNGEPLGLPALNITVTSPGINVAEKESDV